jgi:hypothetical protein
MSDPIVVSLFQTGAIAGVPGTYSPGDYTVDYDARTATLIVDANSQVTSPDPVSTPAPAPTDTPSA